MKQLRSFVFNSPLAIEDFSVALAKMDLSAQWCRGDSEYYGSHVDGKTADGSEVRIFEGEWAGRPEEFVAELLSSADEASREALMNMIIVALGATDWRETSV